MRRVLALGALLVLSACGDQVPTPGGLEAFGLVLSAPTPGDAGFEAAFTVTGQARDYRMQLLVSDGTELIVEVHTPGESDLSTMGGGFGVVAVSSPLTSNAARRSLLVTDFDGPVYAANAGRPWLPLVSAFGPGLVGFGDSLGTEPAGAFTRHHRAARFRTDRGQVEIAPGQVTTVQLGGKPYRAVVIASYVLETKNPGGKGGAGGDGFGGGGAGAGGAGPEPAGAVGSGGGTEGTLIPTACGKGLEVLSYELLRLREDTPSITLQRQANAPLADLGCP